MHAQTGDLKLPRDLVAFLRAGKQLDYDPKKCEVGRVILLPLEKLRLGEIYMESYNSKWELEDPNAFEGYYAIKGVPLVQSCDTNSFNLDGILLWFPGYQQFGQWDDNHYKAYRFAGMRWSDIVANPARFIDAKWRLDDFFVIDVLPWMDDPDYDFRQGPIPRFTRRR